MLYDGTNPIVRIVGVEHLKWGDGDYQVARRPFSALAFRISGTGVITMGETDYFVHSNDILYLPQNVPYTARYSETELIVIHFVTAQDDTAPELYAFENGEKLYKAFLSAHELWTKKKAGANLYILSVLYEVLGTICEQETRAQLPPRFLKAVSLLNARYADSHLNVAAVCREAGIAATTFRQLFRQHYHKTPVEYLLDLRIEHARSLISGGMSVEAAAFESGFNDPKYFARAVKKRFGCTPRTFKNYGK